MKRTALVTGGADGIGLEVCRELARREYRVILTARTLERATGAAETLKGDVHPAALDVTDPLAAGRIAEPAERLKREGRFRKSRSMPHLPRSAPGGAIQ